MPSKPVYRKYFAASNVSNRYGRMRVYFRDAEDDAEELQSLYGGIWFVAEINAHYTLKKNGVRHEKVTAGGITVTL